MNLNWKTTFSVSFFFSLFSHFFPEKNHFYPILLKRIRNKSWWAHLSKWCQKYEEYTFDSVFFRNEVWTIFHKFIYRKKNWMLFVYKNYLNSAPYYKKTCAYNEKHGTDRLFLIFSATFWYASHLCGITTGWVLSLKKYFEKKTWTWEKRPKRFDKFNLWIPKRHT